MRNRQSHHQRAEPRVGSQTSHFCERHHYTDLGAQITGPKADLNLGLVTYVNGSSMNRIQLDTTQAATDTIQYVATLPTGQAGDQSGLTSTSTRTVIIEAAPSIVPTDDASTSATTTAQ